MSFYSTEFATDLTESTGCIGCGVSVIPRLSRMISLAEDDDLKINRDVATH